MAGAQAFCFPLSSSAFSYLFLILKENEHIFFLKNLFYNEKFVCSFIIKNKIVNLYFEKNKYFILIIQNSTGTPHLK